MKNIFRRERTLGKAHGKRRYDLPLNKGAGAGFLVLLIGLMTFLAMLALAASFALSAMTERWTGGLANQITIEIPAEDDSGAARGRAAIDDMARAITRTLEQDSAVEKTHILSDEDIAALVRPWLGENLALDKMPIPGLISVTLHGERARGALAPIGARIREIAPDARIDTHEEWLDDLMRFAGALQFAASVLAIVIGVTTATAIAGAVRARLAVHGQEVEILHLMGASDRYIARQFQRHSLSLALQGGMVGAIAGGIALIVIGWISGEMDVNLLPGFHLAAWQIGALASLPLWAGLLAYLTAGHTTMRVLGRML